VKHAFYLSLKDQHYVCSNFSLVSQPQQYHLMASVIISWIFCAASSTSRCVTAQEEMDPKMVFSKV
jgi:hypothetical protein